MKALVTYYSETGNTEKLARAIYEGAGQVDKQIVPINDAGDLEVYDLIFCGFPVQAHGVPAKVVSFLKTIPEGKKVALFGTHGSLKGGQMAIAGFYHAVSVSRKERVIGTFGCRGKVKFSLLDQLGKSPEHKAWVMEAQSAMGHPDEADLADGREWAKEMVTRAIAC
ncbi:MAG: flavodoxin family protein [Desulfatiglandaceae bacterium]